MVLPDMDHPAVWLILNTNIVHTIIVGTTMPRPIGRQPDGRDVSRTEGDCLNPKPPKSGTRFGGFSDTGHSFKCLLGVASVR
ncbi:MAG: hypothetical protein QOI53_412 [Verrucomicrobiota bacterium]|nr:hypothetical protein [Verrucomicrobiota bacterium]